MSYRKDKELSLINTHNSIDSAELAELFKNNLQAGIHGIAFSAYEEGQEPGVQITEAQIRKRMKILQPHVQWIRSFSCTDGNEMIPVIAKEYGIET